MTDADEDRSDLKRAIREIDDFPKPGIRFFDLTTLFADADAFARTVDALAAQVAPLAPELVVVPEARGFVSGAALAYRLGAGLIIARKPTKLPGPSLSAEYALEYGTDVLHVHEGAIGAGRRALVHDDLLATGGTALATRDLIEQAGGVCVGFSFIVELTFLGGRTRLEAEGLAVRSLVRYASEATAGEGTPPPRAPGGGAAAPPRSA